MRYMLTLAAIPVVVMIGAPTSLLSGQRRPDVPASGRLAAITVAPEGVTERRMDATTFRARWSPVSEMPPTKEIIHEPLLLVSHEPPTAGAGLPVSRPLRAHKVSLHNGVCGRHGLRKVTTRGGKSWRCRR